MNKKIILTFLFFVVFLNEKTWSFCNIKKNKVILIKEQPFGGGIGANSPSCYKNISQTSCYPFLISASNLVNDYSVREFNAGVERQIYTLANESPNGCANNKLCFCSDSTDPSESQYLLPMACKFTKTEDIELSECNLENNDDFIQSVEGCNGDNRCYRLGLDDETKVMVRKVLGQIVEGNTFTDAYLNELKEENKGICLPVTTCEPRPLTEGMTLKIGDTCKPPLATLGEHPNKFCADPALAAVTENMPHEIKFTLDPDSCEIKGFEYDESGELIYQPYAIVENNDTSTGLAFLGEAEQVIKNSTNKNEVQFYPNAAELDQSEKIKMISVTDYKNMSFSKIIRGMEFLWGKADSNALSLDWLTGIRKKLTLGKQAKAAFKRYEVSRKLSEIIQTIETKKIFDVTKEEVDPDAEPLATIKAQMIALEVYKKLLYIELFGLRDLLGGENFWESVNSPSFDIDGDKALFQKFHDEDGDAAYIRSLAYMKNASNSLERGLWERRTNGSAHCPMFCYPLEDCSTSIQCGGECETGDDTLGMDWSGTDEGHKYLIRLCVQDSLNIKDYMDHGYAFNGSMVDAIYPRSITNNHTVSNSVHKGTGKKFASLDKLIENIKDGLKNYSNQGVTPFSDAGISVLNDHSEFQIAQSYIDEFNNLSDVTPLSYNLGEINNMITGQHQCAFGPNLKHVNLKFTAEEYLIRQKNSTGNDPISLQLKIQDILDLKDENKDENDPDKLNKLLNDSSLHYLSRNITDIFIKMHFTKRQEQWRNEGSSQLLGGAGFWNDNPSQSVGFNSNKHVWKGGNVTGDKVGQTLGYINELYGMVEYMYKYRAGLLEGFEKQLVCLNNKVVEFEAEMNKATEKKFKGIGKEIDEGIEEISETNTKIKDFITVQDRLNQIKNACEVVKADVAAKNPDAVATPDGAVPVPGVSGFVDFNPGDQEGLGLGIGKKGLKKRGTPKGGKLSFGKFNFSSAGGLESSAVGKDGSVSQGKSGAGSVSGNSGDGKKAKKSGKDGVKKVLSGLNKLNEAKKDLYSKVKNPSTIDTGDILASVFRPDTLKGASSIDVGKSLKSTDLNKKKKAVKKVQASTKKVKKRRSGSFRSKRKKSFRKKISKKKALRNKKILRAIKKNPGRYNTLEQDTIFTRISKAIVRHGYPIFLDEDNFDVGDLPSTNRKHYNPKHKEKYLD